jgi:RNA polymerase sigma-70 factor, ECF subfamily
MSENGRVSEDDDLVAELRAGRPDAARSLYEAYGPAVYGFVHRRTCDPELSREIVQDVMTSVWRSAPRFDGSRGSFRSWVFQIARNAVTDAGRRNSRRPFVTTSLSPEADGPLAVAQPVEDDVDAFVRNWLITSALERLPADHRAVVDLVYFRQLKVAEAAVHLGIPEGTVKSRCFYAVQNLRTAFHELGVVRGDL